MPTNRGTRVFERQLRANSTIAHVRSFQLRTQDGNDYRLVFGVGHDKGLDLAKDAMWKVDPIAGTAYVATTETGQEVLFSPNVSTDPLFAALRAKFDTAWFRIVDAEQYTRISTPFRVAHLRRKTLTPAEKLGRLEVVRAPGTRGFDGAKMRFVV